MQDFAAQFLAPSLQELTNMGDETGGSSARYALTDPSGNKTSDAEAYTAYESQESLNRKTEESPSEC